MGFLDRLRGIASPVASSGAEPSTSAGALTPRPDRDGWYGRRFRSPLSIEACAAHARALLAGDSDDHVFEARWTGGPPDPDVLLGLRDSAYGAVYVAILESGSMVAGEREIAVVPTRFDGQAPFPLAGQWKMRDSGLGSIGFVTEFPVEPIV